MVSLHQITGFLEHIVIRVGKIAAWAAIAMMLVILFDVIMRRYFVVGSTKLQELEWHLHGLLFLLTLGFAYIRGSHVRIELLREKWSNNTKLWIEFLGCLFLLIPYTLALIIFGWDYTAMAFANAETSASAGLAYRWLIKGAMVAGFILLGFSSLVVITRSAMALFVPGSISKQQLAEILDDHPETT